MELKNIELKETEVERKKWYDCDKSQNKKYVLWPSISLWELLLSHIVWWSCVSYCMFKFYLHCEKWSRYLSIGPVPGGYFERSKDQSDTEWYIWPKVFYKYVYWAILHTVCAEIIRKYAQKLLCLFYTVFSVLILISMFGPIGTGFFFVVPTIMFIVLLSRLKILIWISWWLILLMFNTKLTRDLIQPALSDIPDADYMVSVMIAWIILRSLSFSLEICDTDPHGKRPAISLYITLLGYCYYLPHIASGPYMPFVDFQNGLQVQSTPWTFKKVLSTILQFMRFVFWLQFCEVFLHFFYGHSLLYYPHFVKSLDAWSLAGFGYSMILFFVVKYVVLYGLPCVLTRAEGYNPPQHPKCVLLTYRFSDVWRDFDHGLYRFMLRHIYIPWVGNNRSMWKQTQGTALVFTFVYVWHGISENVFWWSFFNFLGVMAEKAGDSVASLPSYKRWETKWFPGAWKRRWSCIWASCLYVPSVVAVMFFLGNLQTAKIIVDKFFISGFPLNTITIISIFWFLANISMEVQNWRLKQKIKAV